jgi:hypothetical protein
MIDSSIKSRQIEEKCQPEAPEDRDRAVAFSYFHKETSHVVRAITHSILNPVVFQQLSQHWRRTKKKGRAIKSQKQRKAIQNPMPNDSYCINNRLTDWLGSFILSSI